MTRPHAAAVTPVVQGPRMMVARMRHPEHADPLLLRVLGVPRDGAPTWSESGAEPEPQSSMVTDDDDPVRREDTAGIPGHGADSPSDHQSLQATDLPHTIVHTVMRR